MENNKIEILKRTRGICSVCFQEIQAEYMKEGGKIYFCKYCPAHGTVKVLISDRGDEYRELFLYYSIFGLEDKKVLDSVPDQISVFPTTRCNLKCPICFADCGISDTDVRIEDVAKVIRNFKHKKINILGGEATVYPSLPSLIRTIVQSESTPVLFTNGIKIADYDYIKSLKQLGVGEVHLQFDGINDDIYKSLRNKELLGYKLQAAQNLNRLDIKVVLEALIDGKINSSHVGEIIKFALQYKNVKGINFRTYFVLGKKEDRDGQLLLDDLIQAVETQTNGRINRKEILEFQKILYAVASIFSIKICLKHRFFIIYKKGQNNFISVNQMFNLDRLAGVIVRFKELKQKKSRFSNLYFCLCLILKLPFIVNRKNILFIFNYIAILINKKLFGISISKRFFRDNSLMINFERPCDNDTFDLNETCDNMVIDCNGENFRTFYLASIEREKLKNKRIFK